MLGSRSDTELPVNEGAVTVGHVHVITTLKVGVDWTHHQQDDGQTVLRDGFRKLRGNSNS